MILSEVILDPVCRNVIPDSLVNLDTLDFHQVIVEGSEGLPGRADCHIGECDLSDGEDLNSMFSTPIGRGLTMLGSHWSRASER